jgi:hypothetical protein
VRNKDIKGNLPEPGSDELGRARQKEGEARPPGTELVLKRPLVPDDVRVAVVSPSPSESNSGLVLDTRITSDDVYPTCLTSSVCPRPRKSRNIG